jgi:hypothetical protein
MQKMTWGGQAGEGRTTRPPHVIFFHSHGNSRILTCLRGPFFAHLLPVNRLSTSRFSRLIALLAVLPAIASAHPGHDGGHDLTWDFGNGLGHVHYGQALLVGAGVGIAKLAARFFKN